MQKQVKLIFKGFFGKNFDFQTGFKPFLSPYVDPRFKFGQYRLIGLDAIDIQTSRRFLRPVFFTSAYPKRIFPMNAQN